MLDVLAGQPRRTHSIGTVRHQVSGHVLLDEVVRRRFDDSPAPKGIKTPEQAAVYGGTAGVAYDPCYHQECDTINNVNTKALAEMSDAAAHAILTLVRTESGFYEDGSRSTTRPRFDYRGPDAVR